MRPILKLPHQQENFWSKFAGLDPEACWPYPGARRPQVNGKRDYGLVGFTTAPKTRQLVGAHRVAFYTANPESEDGWVCHKCDNPPCCNPDHLYLGDPRTNANDRMGIPSDTQADPATYWERQGKFLRRGDKIPVLRSPLGPVNPFQGCKVPAFF